jgi:protein tyrosine/serine phosphatase
MTRILLLEGVDNFRDYGGYRTASGGEIRRGRLYRSATHGRATPGDLAVMADLDIAVVVDLRREAERQRDPSPRPPGWRGAVIEHGQGEADDDAWAANVRNSDLSEAAFRDYMVGYYRKAPFEERHIALFRRYFEALAQTDGPVLIHCAAGKDRTGILAALTHQLLGVHQDDIMHDFLLTNDQAYHERRLPVMKTVIKEISGREPTEKAVRVAMSVEPVYLENAFAVIADRAGGAKAYLEEVLGVDAARRAAIEEKLIA